MKSISWRTSCGSPIAGSRESLAPHSSAGFAGISPLAYLLPHPNVGTLSPSLRTLRRLGLVALVHSLGNAGTIANEVATVSLRMANLLLKSNLLANLLLKSNLLVTMPPSPLAEQTREVGFWAHK